MPKCTFAGHKICFLICSILVCVPFAGLARAGEDTLESFDDARYRQLAQEYLVEIGASGRVMDRPPSEEGDEKLAAYWYAVRKAGVSRLTPWTGKLVGRLSRGSEHVKRLYGKHSQAVELLSLCLAFANESKDRAYSPFIERALPFVILAEQGHMQGPLAEELQYNFFFPFVRMLGSAASQKEREGGFVGRKQSPERYLLLDPANATTDDIRMWASLVRHYGGAEQRKGKWAGLLKSVSEYEEALAVSDQEKMNISEAYERAARAGLNGLAQRDAANAGKSEGRVPHAGFTLGARHTGLFDDLAYRTAIEKLMALSKEQEITPPEAGATDEEVAAYCYVIRERYWQNTVDVRILFAATPLVDDLFKRNPTSPALLTLRFSYGFAEAKRRFSPFLELAYPYVIGGEQFREEQWHPDLVKYFYASFFPMLIAEKEQRQQAQKLKEKGRASRIEFDRDFFLYSFENESPQEDDLRMWASLVMKHVEKLPVKTRKWNRWVARIKKMMPDLKRMPQKELRTRLASLVSQSLATRCAGSTRNDEVDRAVSRAYFRGLEQGKKERKASKTKVLSDELQKEKAQLEKAAATFSGTWEAHRALCEFYVRNRLRENDSYPPAQFAMPKTADDYNALAYYQLIVRTTLRRYRPEAARRTIQFTDKALQLDPGSARAYALRAWAFARQEDDQAAAEALEQARRLDAENAEYLFVKPMVERARRRNE